MVRARCLLWARLLATTFIIDHDIDIIVVEVVKSRTFLFIAGKCRSGCVGIGVF